MNSDLTLWPYLSRLLARNNLSDNSKAAILALPFKRHLVEASRDLIPLGASATELIILEDGVLASFQQTGRGVRQFTAIHLPGDMANLGAVAQPRVSTPIQALASSKVLRIPREAIKGLISDFPCIAEALWRESVAEASVAVRWLLSLGRKPARARIAHLLCELAAREGHVDEQVWELKCGIRQIHIADATGLTAVHVNRVIQDLKAEHLITYIDGRIAIRNVKQLGLIGGFQPDYLNLPSDVTSIPLVARRRVSRSSNPVSRLDHSVKLLERTGRA